VAVGQEEVSITQPRGCSVSVVGSPREFAARRILENGTEISKTENVDENGSIQVGYTGTSRCITTTIRNRLLSL